MNIKKAFYDSLRALLLPLALYAEGSLVLFMAGVTTAMPTSFKVELMSGLQNFVQTTGNDYKVALIKVGPTGTYDATTTNYSTLTGNSDEVSSGGGYTTGGYDITAANNTTPTSSSTTAYTTPGVNPSWTSATFSTIGCLMYNATNSNRAAYVGSFGGTQSVSAGTLTLLMPTNNSSSALLRLA